MKSVKDFWSSHINGSRCPAHLCEGPILGMKHLIWGVHQTSRGRQWKCLTAVGLLDLGSDFSEQEEEDVMLHGQVQSREEVLCSSFHNTGPCKSSCVQLRVIDGMTTTWDCVWHLHLRLENITQDVTTLLMSLGCLILDEVVLLRSLQYNRTFVM